MSDESFTRSAGPSISAPDAGILALAADYLALRRTLLSGEEIVAMALALIQAEQSRATNARLLDEALRRLHGSGEARSHAGDTTRELLEQARLALEACDGPADCCGTADNGRAEWPLKLELLHRIQEHLNGITKSART